jgi:class 3 adenylate cyclase/pimeloyl-ACP methyl ester carboxylesterase
MMNLCGSRPRAARLFYPVAVASSFRRCWSRGVADAPATRYAKTAGGGHVAYQLVGDGPIDVLVNRHLFFPVDLMWDEPRLVHFLNRLSSFCRHIWFDPRGTGASDWIPHAEGRLVESIVDDMVAVLDAVGCERVALLGLGPPLGLMFAATHPERTTALVLVDATARYRRAEDYPQGLSDEEIDERVEHASHAGQYYESRRTEVAPSVVDDTRFWRWLERARRLTCPPDDYLWRLRSSYDIDLRDVLGSIRAPTLIVNRQDRRAAAQTLYLADHIEAARYVELPGADILPFVGDVGAVLGAIEEFLTGQLAPPQTDRVLATVLFTDVVDSTPQAARLGDRRWRELLATHDAIVGDELARHRGRAVKFTGDGVLATFDGPARAIRCAFAIRDAIQMLGLQVRAGLHTGEIELRGDDVSGIAVHIGQRVASLAGAGEVLVSRTVADLLAGSEIDFHDRGEHELKGVAGTWRLFSVPG